MWFSFNAHQNSHEYHLSGNWDFQGFGLKEFGLVRVYSLQSLS